MSITRRARVVLHEYCSGVERLRELRRSAESDGTTGRIVEGLGRWGYGEGLTRRQIRCTRRHQRHQSQGQHWSTGMMVGLIDVEPHDALVVVGIVLVRQNHTGTRVVCGRKVPRDVRAGVSVDDGEPSRPLVRVQVHVHRRQQCRPTQRGYRREDGHSTRRDNTLHLTHCGPRISWKSRLFRVTAARHTAA